MNRAWQFVTELASTFRREVADKGIPTLVNAWILYALSTAGPWLFLVGGYVLAELFGTSTRSRNLDSQLQMKDAELQRAISRIEVLENEVWLIRDRIETPEVLVD